MENWFPLPFLPQKSIDKPSGAYYNVLAVTDRWADLSAHLERGRQSLRHGCAVPPPFTQGRLSSRYTYRDVAQFGSALRSGRRGRRFESCHLDQKERVGVCLPFLFGCICSEMKNLENAARHFLRFCACTHSDTHLLGAKPRFESDKVQNPVHTGWWIQRNRRPLNLHSVEQ